MKWKFKIVLMLVALASFASYADEPASAPDPNEPPSPEKVGYALGMNLGLQIKRIGSDVDVDVMARAIRDVLAEKPTEVQESEIRPLFIQAQQYEVTKKNYQSTIDGEAFLTKNAKAPGITMFPDGLQYRVLKEGTGELPNPTNSVIVSFRCTWADGTEFLRKDKVEMPLELCPKGIREALQHMKAGSKWQIFVPSALAYTYQPKQAYGYGSTLVYELELFPSGTPTSGEHFGGGRLGHPPGDEFLPSNPNRSNPSPTQNGQIRAEPVGGTPPTVK